MGNLTHTHARLVSELSLPTGPASRRFVLALSLVAFVGSCRCGPQRQPDVLFLVIDSLRADHLGFAGYSRPTSPMLDSLAAEGVAFTCCTAQAPYTLPSVPSLVTGRYPTSAVHWTSVVLPCNDTTYAAELGGGVASIAAILGRHGYRTGFFNTSSNIKLRLFGLKNQFGHVDESVQCMSGDCAARVNARAIEWLSKQRGRPWLCYIHYMDVHLPYKAPANFAGRFSKGYGVLPNLVYVDRQWRSVSRDPGPEELAHVIGMYDAEIAYLDSQVGALLRKLDALGMARNLLVIVASDHGDELFERGAFGHGQTLYQEQIACPLIFAWPSRVPRGVTIDCPIRNIDITPTIIDLVGVPLLINIQGSSLVPYFRGDCPRLPIFSESRGYSVRTGDWKVWREKVGLWRLYNLRTDPAETRDMALDEPDTLKALRAHLRAWRDSVVPPAAPRAPEPTSTLDSTSVGNLRALGYVE